MTSSTLKMTAVLVGALLYWALVCRVAGVDEPWDAESYWRLWYPVAVVLSAGGGWLLGRRGWLAGLIVTFAQAAVMAWNGGIGAFWVVGLLTLCVSAIPLVSVSAVTGLFAARSRAG